MKTKTDPNPEYFSRLEEMVGEALSSVSCYLRTVIAAFFFPSRFRRAAASNERFPILSRPVSFLAFSTLVAQIYLEFIWHWIRPRILASVSQSEPEIRGTLSQIASREAFNLTWEKLFGEYIPLVVALLLAGRVVSLALSPRHSHMQERLSSSFYYASSIRYGSDVTYYLQKAGFGGDYTDFVAQVYSHCRDFYVHFDCPSELGCWKRNRSWGFREAVE